MTWTDGPFLGFDTETTGVNPLSDRIVTAALIGRRGGHQEQRTWLINPGVDIPAAASNIHGITNEKAQAEGADPKIALEEIALELAAAFNNGIPVVAYNGAFDLTLIEAELHRNGLPTIAERLGRPLAPVVDPLVLDRGVDRYRKGKRKLVDLCAHYGVEESGDLHTADVDVVATLDVLVALTQAHPELAQMSLAELHEFQQVKHREWAEEFNQWRQKKGFSGAGADPTWPVHGAR